jgi:hypothetical protein
MANIRLVALNGERESAPPRMRHEASLGPSETSLVFLLFTDGAYRDRTDDLLVANQALSQLS